MDFSLSDFLITVGLTFLVVVFIANLFYTPEHITKTYFDNSVVVEVTHNGAFKSDEVRFIFTEPGNYEVTILPYESHDHAPQGFDIILSEGEIPAAKTIYKFSISDIQITIRRNDLTEIHNFITKSE